MKKRVFVYIRVSTQEQAEEGYSLAEQEERLSNYCKAMEWNLVKVFSDPAYSGGNTNRPALNQMIKCVQNKEADIVLVDKLDRLSRSQYDTLYLIKKVFNENDVAFVSRAEAFDTSTSFGRAMVGILAVFAELERERIKERMMEGKEGRIKEGKFQGGNKISFGYDYDREKGILVKNEYQAMIVNEIFEMISQRIPMNTIARELNHKGYATRNKSKWSDITLRQMATNKTYIGLQMYQGEWHESLHEPIVSTDLFENVQKIMSERSIKNEKYKPCKKYNSPLGGMIWCGKCGAKYHWKKSRNRSYYVCYSRSKSDAKLVKDPNCKNQKYDDQILDQAIYDEIRKLKSNKHYIDDVKNSMDVQSKISLIEKQIAGLNKQISNLMQLFSLDGIDKADIQSQIAPLTKERNLLESEISLLEEESSPMTKEAVLELVDVFEKCVASGDNAAIHDAIMELIDFITIDDDQVQIHWNF